MGISWEFRVKIMPGRWFPSTEDGTSHDLSGSEMSLESTGYPLLLRETRPEMAGLFRIPREIDQGHFDHLSATHPSALGATLTPTHSDAIAGFQLCNCATVRHVQVS